MSMVSRAIRRRLSSDWRKLGDPVDEAGNIPAKHLLHLVQGGLGILHHIVQQGGDDGIVVQLEIGEDARHFEGVRKVGVAGRAGLQTMGLHREDIGSVQSVFVGTRIIGSDLFRASSSAPGS
jgi:hypothetical protein